MSFRFTCLNEKERLQNLKKKWEKKKRSNPLHCWKGSLAFINRLLKRVPEQQIKAHQGVYKSVCLIFGTDESSTFINLFSVNSYFNVA